jgi:phosphatidylglycerophosphatase A
MGTVVAVPLFLLLCQLPPLVYWLTVLVATAAGIWICGRAAEILGVHDHGGIVWDEMAGYWIAMAVTPVTWQTVFAGFLLFRLFDIWKPWPISWCDKKVHGGAGIMLDDVIAGVFAAILLWISVMFLPGVMGL